MIPKNVYCIIILFLIPAAFLKAQCPDLTEPDYNCTPDKNGQWGTIIWPPANNEYNCADGDWELIFEDDFEGNALDQQKWLPNYPYGSYVPGEANVAYSPNDYTSNIQVSNGTLKLIAKQETIVARAIGYEPDNLILCDQLPNLRTFYYTGGMIHSHHLSGKGGPFSSGKFEMRCKIPSIDGFWPSFWLFSKGLCYQEIDVFEFGSKTLTESASDGSKRVDMTYLKDEDCNDGVANRCGNQENYNSCTNYSLDFHTFSVEWDAYQITWRIDGNAIRTIYGLKTILGQPISECNLAQGIYERNNIMPNPADSMFILANLKVWDFYSPKPNDNPCDAPFYRTQVGYAPVTRGTFPAIFEIDYIRAWKKVPLNDPIYTCTPFRPDEVEIDQSHFHGTDVLHVNNSITNNGPVTVHGSADVWWTAGESIELLPGFTSDEGSRFLAEIADCEHGFLRTQIGSESDSIIEKSLHISGDSILLAHPNPVKEGLLYIKCTGQNSKLDIVKGYDLTGRKVFQLKNVDCNSLTLDLSALEKGVYIFRFFNGSQEATRKILIE